MHYTMSWYELQHTTDEEATASKRLIFYFIFCAIIQLTELLLSTNCATQSKQHFCYVSCTIVNYHQLSRSLDVLKFDMIVDNSFFFRLIAGTIVNDSFSVSSFAKDGLNLTIFRQDSVRREFADISSGGALPYMAYKGTCRCPAARLCLRVWFLASSALNRVYNFMRTCPRQGLNLS